MGNDTVPTDPREMRLRISRLVHRGDRISTSQAERWGLGSPVGPVARNTMMFAEASGYSGEDAYTMLAYHALVMLEQQLDLALHEAMLRPAPQVVVDEHHPIPTRRAL